MLTSIGENCIHHMRTEVSVRGRVAKRLISRKEAQLNEGGSVHGDDNTRKVSGNSRGA